MTYENLPKELQEKEIFCLWKYEKDKNDTSFDVALSKIKDYGGAVLA